MDDKPTFVGVDLAGGEDLGLKRTRCSLGVIKGIASWASPSMALRFDAAAQTLPYMVRPPKEAKKVNGGRRQRLRMRR
jgi:hypothetical protein